MNYSLQDALALMKSMEAGADKEYDAEDNAGNSGLASFWGGWAEGLETLRHHIETGVKVTCFPIGNCSCHPFTIKGE